MSLVHAAVTTASVDPEALRTQVTTPAAGAVATFVGIIRDHDPEAHGEVTGIEYTHHPDADRLIGELVERVVGGGGARVAAVHRVGRLAVGDVALVVAVATAHRREAFTWCAEVVEAIKAELPIWKQQFEADGRAVWSNLGIDR
ncbi:MAG: molybdenum cofactor biosynthesis protein MoaE [Arachnia sp.]